MNFHFPSKRIHSPTDDDSNNTTTIIPDEPHARKKVITDDMFTNKMAGLSLAYSIDNNPNQDSTNVLNNNDHSSCRWRQDLVERVDDIDQYLDNDGEHDTIEDEDTYLGAAPELVGVAMGNTVLPFERIPGATGLRIPDFVLHNNSNNDDAIDRAVYESAQKQLHQYYAHHLPSPMDTDQPQPMDLD